MLIPELFISLRSRTASMLHANINWRPAILCLFLYFFVVSLFLNKPKEISLRTSQSVPNKMVNKMLTKSVLHFLNVSKHSRKMFQNVAELFWNITVFRTKCLPKKFPKNYRPKIHIVYKIFHKFQICLRTIGSVPNKCITKMFPRNVLHFIKCS